MRLLAASGFFLRLRAAPEWRPPVSLIRWVSLLGGRFDGFSLPGRQSWRSRLHAHTRCLSVIAALAALEAESEELCLM